MADEPSATPIKEGMTPEEKAAAAKAMMEAATLSDKTVAEEKSTGSTSSSSGSSGVATAPGAEPADAAGEKGPKKGKKGKKGKPAAEQLDGTFFTVKVYSPYQTFYDGEAVSLSAENDTGPFDILPRHHNFMTLVNACEVIIRMKEGEGEDKKIRITRGVMHVRNNKVTLFLDV